MATEQWIFVEFVCDNGFEKTITSIPESEIDSALKYLADKYTNIRELVVKK